MTKGTSLFGKCHNNTFTMCCHCDYTTVRSYSAQNISNLLNRNRKYNWSDKTKQSNAPSTGQMRHLRIVYHKFRHGFPEGTTPQSENTALAKSTSCDNVILLIHKKRCNTVIWKHMDESWDYHDKWIKSD